jgi:hypothetical protein
MTRISAKAHLLLQKAQDSAILAVEIYNKPATKFRSYGFIVLMVIAWTSLLHAIFEKNHIKYYYRKKDTRFFQYIDGEKKAWELSECCNTYFTDKNSPIYKNIDFFIQLRNRIEHRFLPALDPEICGECQSFLHNFEKIMISEFGDDFSLNESLAIPIQLYSTNPKWKSETMKALHSRDYEIIKNYIDVYRQTLNDEVWNSDEFSFRVFLVPKIGNNRNTSDLAIEFIPFNYENPEEMENYSKIHAIIKERNVPVANPGKLRPSDVSKIIEERLGITFSSSFHHSKCWKFFNIRPDKGSDEPTNTQIKYCQYDAAHGDYVYTQEWVDKLLKDLADEGKRGEIFES